MSSTGVPEVKKKSHGLTFSLNLEGLHHQIRRFKITRNQFLWTFYELCITNFLLIIFLHLVNDVLFSSQNSKYL